MAHYHIIGGTVYQAPDLASILNSRLSTGLDKILTAFNDCQSASNFHPNKGYSWELCWKKLKKKKMGKNLRKNYDFFLIFFNTMKGMAGP